MNPDVTTARRRLDLAEASFRSADALQQIDEALDLLEDAATAGPIRERAVARNLGITYVNRFAELVSGALAARDVPEPELKHLLKLLQLLDGSAFSDAADDDLRALIGAVADRYLDTLFEGYSASEREREIARLKKRLVDTS